MSAVFDFRLLTGLVRRGLALGCAALVLALSVFAASPSAHGLLHDDDHQHALFDDACAVVMFASGVSLPFATSVTAPPSDLVQRVKPGAAAEVFLVSPRYLRQPERGPPSGWVS